MTEKLLQYIWQFQYFNASELKTVKGEELEIIFPGTLNYNQGPDFSNARIKIDKTILAGSVEIHLKSSQWVQHGHQPDPNYKNVILHVVLEDDDASEVPHIPVLELQPRISKILLQHYSMLMKSTAFIPCAADVKNVKDITWAAWKERLLAERLTRKANIVFDYLNKNQYHWEESFWWLLARNFGMKVNGDAFEAIARSLSVNILAKHKSQIHQLEALLLGQAHLLNKEWKDDYPCLLQREYKFLKAKYQLQVVHVPVHSLRMRPGNFPTVRLAQLAMLIHHSAHLFSKILEAENLEDIKALFKQTANDYWLYHYTFDQSSSFKKKTIGEDMVSNIVINSIAPILFAYGLHYKEERYKTKAIAWLDTILAEKNFITKGFTTLGLSNKTAFDSQAYIELKTRYCNQKNCLQCAIGNALLKNSR